MVYNTKLFEQAGLDPNSPPSNWDELKDAVEKISALGDDIYGIDIPGGCANCVAYGFQSLALASGQKLVTDPGTDQKTQYAKSSDLKDALEMYHEFWDKGYANPKGQTETGPTWGEDFNAGKVGIILGGGYLVGQAKEAGQTAAAAPIPGKDGGYAGFAGGDNVGITAKSKNVDASWTFIEWLLGKDAQMLLAEDGQPPVRSDLLDDSFKDKYPAATVAMEIGDKSVGTNSIATNALQFSASSPWASLFQKVVFEGADFEETAKKADSDSRTIIEQAYEQLGV